MRIHPLKACATALFVACLLTCAAPALAYVEQSPYAADWTLDERMTDSDGTGGTRPRSEPLPYPEDQEIIDYEPMMNPATEEEMALSDLFYNGVNYIDYINTQLAKKIIEHGEVVEDPESVTDPLRLKRPFAGLPNDYPFFTAYRTREGTQLYLWLDRENPYVALEARQESECFAVPLGHDISPWGQCTLGILPGAANQPSSFVVDGGARPKVDARLREAHSKLLEAFADPSLTKVRTDFDGDRETLFAQWRHYLSMRCASATIFTGAYDDSLCAMVLAYNLIDLHTGKPVSAANWANRFLHDEDTLFLINPVAYGPENYVTYAEREAEAERGQEESFETSDEETYDDEGSSSEHPPPADWQQLRKTISREIDALRSKRTASSSGDEDWVHDAKACMRDTLDSYDEDEAPDHPRLFHEEEISIDAGADFTCYMHYLMPRGTETLGAWFDGQYMAIELKQPDGLCVRMLVPLEKFNKLLP